jgi:hypothetical protein
LPEVLVSELELALPLELWLLDGLPLLPWLLDALPLSPPCADEVPLIEADPCEELPLRLLALDADELPVLSAASVWSSICPEACRPFCCWNFFSADFVFGPAMPSTGPALKPWSFNACCTCVTLELSLADDEDEDDCEGEDCEDGSDCEDCEDCEDDGDELLIAGVWL